MQRYAYGVRLVQTGLTDVVECPAIACPEVAVEVIGKVVAIELLVDEAADSQTAYLHGGLCGFLLACGLQVGCVYGSQCLLCLLSQRCWQAGNGGIEVIVDLSPRQFYFAERRRRAGGDKIGHIILVPILQVGLDVHTLGVLCYQSEFDGEVDGLVALWADFPFFYPFGIESGEFAKLGHADGGTAVTVNPRVAYL